MFRSQKDIQRIEKLEKENLRLMTFNFDVINRLKPQKDYCSEINLKFAEDRLALEKQLRESAQITAGTYRIMYEACQKELKELKDKIKHLVPATT